MDKVMTTRLTVSFFLALGLAAHVSICRGQTAGESSSGPAVRVELVKEVRSNWDASKRSPQESPELAVSIRISGIPVEKVRRCSYPILDKAVDDTGKDLMRARPGTAAAEKPVFFNLAANAKEITAPNGYPLLLRLKESARWAKSIKQIEGSVTVIAGGDLKEVLTDAFTDDADQQIENADLSAAGLKVKIATDPKSSSRKVVSVNGPGETVMDVHIVDAAGKSISPVGQGQDQDGAYRWTLPVKTLAGSKLKLSLVSHPDIIRIPINLKDVRLP